MSEPDLEARIDAVERAITDSDAGLDGLGDAAALSGDVEDLAERVSAIEKRLDELEAAVQAVRGYAGNVRAVNRDVERRANAALAKAERLEGPTAAAGPSGDRNRESGSDPVPADSAEDREPSRTPRERSRGADGGRSGDPDAPRTEIGETTGDAVTRVGRDSPGRNPAGDDRSGKRTGPGTAGDRAGADGSTSRAEIADADGSTDRTERFIERVRDAL